jgi:hypothetical protein
MRFTCLIFGLGLISLAPAGCNKPKAKATVEEKIVPVATLTAEELVDEYKKNQIGADHKFKEKPIQITGKVSGTGQMPVTGLYFLNLGSGREGELDVMCVLDRDDKATEAKAASLKEGDTVTLIGRCEGKALGVTAIRLMYCFVPK